MPPELGFSRAVGRAIRAIRRDREITQEELAEKAGLHFTWISRIESETVNPSIDTLAQLSRGLGVSLADLIAYAEELDRFRLPRPQAPIAPPSHDDSAH